MKNLLLVLSVLAIPLGAILFYLAELDDSPGGQLIGTVISITGAIIFFKQIKLHRH